VKHIGWRGIADLLTVFETGCEIYDFKTGERSENHPFQLRVYALLWHRDSALNPGATLARRLVISYPDGDVEVAPLSEGELDVFEQVLIARSDAAHKQLDQRPPPALPGPEACAWCPVRHLCTDYWQPATLRQTRPANEEGARYEDVELELDEPHGPGMWSAAIRASSFLETGKSVKVQVDASHADLMQAGRRYRILGAQIIEREDFDDTRETLVAASAWTEVFVLAPA
jgi:hypothetical protein